MQLYATYRNRSGLAINRSFFKAYELLTSVYLSLKVPVFKTFSCCYSVVDLVTFLSYMNTDLDGWMNESLV